MRVIAILFMLLLILYFVSIFVSSRAKANKAPVQEPFEEDNESPSPSPEKVEKKSDADDSSQYKMRFTAMRLFDTLLQKKPTVLELKKYGSMDSQADILKAMIQDYKLFDGNAETQKDTVEEEKQEEKDDSHATDKEDESPIKIPEGDKICFSRDALMKLLNNSM